MPCSRQADSIRRHFVIRVSKESTSDRFIRRRRFGWSFVNAKSMRSMSETAASLEKCVRRSRHREMNSSAGSPWSCCSCIHLCSTRLFVQLSPKANRKFVWKSAHVLVVALTVFHQEPARSRRRTGRAAMASWSGMLLVVLYELIAARNTSGFSPWCP